MSQLMSSLAPSDWIELIGLLASVSGLLVVGASLVGSSTPASGLEGDGTYPRRRKPFLNSAIRRHGILFLACGGALFAFAELVEVLIK